MAPSVVSASSGRSRGADARSVSRVRSLGPWLVPATLAAALSARAASRGDEALNDLPYFAEAAGPARARHLRRPEPAGRAAVARARFASQARRCRGSSSQAAPTLVARDAVATRSRAPAPDAARGGRDDPRARPRTAVLRVRERPRRPAARPAALAQRVPRRAPRPRLDARRSSSEPPRGSRRGGCSASRCCWRCRCEPRSGPRRAPWPWRRPSTSRSSSAATSAWRSTAGGSPTARPSRSSSEGEFPWSLRLAQGVLAVTVGAAIVLASRRSVAGGVAAAGAVVAVRLLLDPERHGWYWIAPQLLAVALGVALAGASLVVARKAVVRQRLPRRRVGDVLVPLRPDPRILVERAEPDPDRRPVVGARPREQA